MSLFMCPVCRERLTRVGNSLKCINSHSFDISSSGDVYLLRASKGVHGDSREMVLARRDFLDRGFYSPLREKLSETAVKYARGERVNYFDAGCGTGYYTDGVANALSERGDVNTVGVDISKDAVKISAKRIKTGEFAVASLYDLPIADDTFDIVTNVFSPMAEEELKRITKKDGVLLYVVPAARHLFSMKKVLYENPYENEEIITEYDGFSHIERISVESRAVLQKDEISPLFSMTPYFWRTPEEGVKNLQALDSLEVEFSFYIHVYKRV